MTVVMTKFKPNTLENTVISMAITSMTDSKMMWDELITKQIASKNIKSYYLIFVFKN